MSPEAWQRIRELYLRALELPAEERADLIARACVGEPAILAEVSRMLAIDERAAAARLDGPLLTTSDTLLGTVLGGCRLERSIAAGGMGTVFEARDSDGRRCAVKVLSGAATVRPHAAELFRREAAVLSRLKHPGIVPILTFGQQAGLFYSVMPFVEGRSLGELIRDAGAGLVHPYLDLRSPTACALLMANVLDALQHVHEHGVIHRDVKPDNILIDAQGRPCLVDFGIAKDLTLDGFTRTGEMSGTPHYMSPEQIRAVRASLDHRSDLFSAGAVLYELLTHRRPFDGKDLHEVLDRIVRDEPRSIRSLNRRVNRTIARICHCALSKDPDYRFPSAVAFASLLRSAVRGNVISVRRRPIRRRVADWCRRRPRVAAATCGALLTALSLGMASAFAAAAATDSALVEVRVGALGGVSEFDVVALAPEPGRDPRVVLTRTAVTAPVTFHVPPGTMRFGFHSTRGNDELYRELEPGTTIVVEPAVGGEPRAGMVFVTGRPHRLALERRHGIEHIDVTVTDFWIDRATVTNADYVAFLRAVGDVEALAESRWDADAGRRRRADWDGLPATGMSWQRARDFAEWRHARLPTVAEWEVAVADSLQASWPTLDGPDAVSARFVVARITTPLIDYRSYLEHVAPSDDGGSTLAHGLGNVWEWVEEPWFEFADGAWIPHRELRVAKGHCWSSAAPRVLDSAWTAETFMPSFSGSVDVGFRCARSVPKSSK